MVSRFAIAVVVGLVACARTSPPSSSPAIEQSSPGTPQGDCAPTGADDAPAVVLFEHNPWLLAIGSDFPTIAIWLDGTVVFLREQGRNVETWQTSIRAADAKLIANAVAEQIRGVPPHSSVSHWADQETVRIVVRDGSEWRVADVYGLTRDGPPVPTVSVPCPPGAKRRVCAYIEDPQRRPTEPAGFFAAYRVLLDARPTTGVPFTPTDIKVLYWGFEHARGTPLPWPSDVPPPPKQAVPSGSLTGRALSFVIASRYEPALHRLLQAARSTDPPRAITFNGHKWTVVPIRRYRGQETIDRLVWCARDRRREMHP